MENCIYTNPLPLLNIKDDNILKVINNYLPYSIGIEFECPQKVNYNIELFKNIPNIMDVDVDTSEQRYRIPKGLSGLICLWNICYNLKEYSILNTESSIHYHTDMSDVWNLIDNNFIENNIDWILEELKTWETAKDYSRIKSWYRWKGVSSFNTLEIRIGEPSFDYSIIIKRIIQCTEIVRKLKRLLYNPTIKLELLQEQLKKLREKEVEEVKTIIELNLDDYKNIIKKKIIKL